MDDVQLDDINGQVSWIFETSPQNYQAGILIDEADTDATNLALIDAIMSELADKGLIKADKSCNNAVRYMRLPSASTQSHAKLVCGRSKLYKPIWQINIRLQMLAPLWNRPGSLARQAVNSQRQH